MPSKLFLWDIDGTVVSSSLESQFIAFLRSRGMVSNWKLARRFLALALANARLPWHALKLAYLRSETRSDVAGWIENWWPTAWSTVRPGARSAISRLREAGMRQAFLSGTLQELGERLAEDVGIADVLAAQPEMNGDRYTGSLLEPHPHGRFKVTYADRWLREQNLDWANVVALADHDGDQFLLEKAGTAVAVNPSPGLEALARERGWHVVLDADLPELVTRLT